MANYTVNQNRQLYVVKGACKTTVSGSSLVQTDLANIGDIQVKKTPDGAFYFVYKGAETVLRSDIINAKNFDYGKALKASDMITPLKKVKITLDSNINEGAPVSGEDYELIIHLPGFYLDSAIDDYYKYGIVHATSSMSASDFYKALVKSLNANFSREVDATAKSNPYLKFTIGYSTNSESEEGDANWEDASANCIYITAKEPVWTLGTEQQRMIDFEALPQTIYTGGDDVIWAAQDATTGKYYTVVANTKTVGTDAYGNGKKIADLEYFCMGERGDQYRNMGWPNVIETKYLVESDKQYNVLELHFAFTDSGVNSYRSEKDITLVFPVGDAGHEYDVINAVIAAINNAAGTTIATLSD